MPKTLGLIYTAPAIVEPVTKIVSDTMPGVQKFNIVDDRIILVIVSEGLSPKVHRIVANYVRGAEDEGADAVLVTCSSISPCVETARRLVSIPVMKMDDPMTDLAVEHGSSIAVIATASATLGPTAQLLQDKAKARGKNVNVSMELCKGAFEALHNKDVQTHDRLVMDAIRRNAQTADVIVLAQASMARIVPQLGNQVKIPVLTSLKSGIEQVKPVLAV